MAGLYNDDGELNVFGFTVKRKKEAAPLKSFVAQADDAGGTEITTSSGAAHNAYSIDMDGSNLKNDADIISKYREMSLVGDIDLAISDIVDEFLVLDEAKPTVELDFTEAFAEKYSEKTKKSIIQEFEYILSLLNFAQVGHDIVRNWYVDGRTAYHKVVDPAQEKKGIQELRPIDVAKLKKVVEIKKEQDNQTQANLIKSQREYYVYSERGFAGDFKSGLKINSESIAYVTSGIQDRNSGTTISYLHKAIRPLNQLRMMEDSDVIYRMVRAPERRVYYIDTSGMARTKAEQHIKDVMARYKNKQVYDANTGTLKDDKKHLSILEDFWLPRSNGGKGTEITTLPSGGSLGALENTEYFQTKLWQSLGVPISRMQQQGSFSIGRGNEINRDEVKFSKFIAKLRRRFSMLFYDLLKTQLILKGIATAEDWSIIKDQLVFRFAQDNFWAELKDSDMFKERMANVAVADQFVGKYFSERYVMRNILHMTDAEITEMKEKIAEETPEAPPEEPEAQAAPVDENPEQQ